MSKTIKQIADEIRDALPPLKCGISVKRSKDDTDSILIGNDNLAFAITRLDIEDNRYLLKAKTGYPHLLSSIAQYHALLAIEADTNMALSVITSSLAGAA